MNVINETIIDKLITGGLGRNRESALIIAEGFTRAPNPDTGLLIEIIRDAPEDIAISVLLSALGHRETRPIRVSLFMVGLRISKGCDSTIKNWSDTIYPGVNNLGPSLAGACLLPWVSRFGPEEVDLIDSETKTRLVNEWRSAGFAEAALESSSGFDLSPFDYEILSGSA